MKINRQSKNNDVNLPSNPTPPLENVLSDPPLPQDKDLLTVFFKNEARLSLDPTFLATHSSFVEHLISYKGMQDSHLLHLNDFLKEDFETLLNLLKTNDLSLISPGNALELIALADFLQIPKIESLALAKLIKGPSSLDRLLKAELLVHGFFQRVNLSDAISNKIQESLIKKEKLPPFRDQYPFLLSLNGKEILDSHLETLAPLTLNALSLTKCSSISGKGLEALKNVEEFTLFRCRLKDEDFERLPLQFSKLDLSYTKEIGEKALKRFKEMPHLKSLCLQNTDFCSRNLPLLPQTLEDLNIKNCTHDQTLSLEKFTSLNTLNLMDVPIKDDDLIHLPKSLETLFLNSCNEITDKGVLGLKESLPNLKTLGISGCRNLSDDLEWQFPESIKIV